MAVRIRGNRWYYDFMIRGVRYRESVREALPGKAGKRQAEIAEAEARIRVFEGRYCKEAGRELFETFVKDKYLPWAEDNKRSWRQDRRYTRILCAYFKDMRLADITPYLVEQYKRSRREGLTRRGLQRNEGTVNREFSQLSRIFGLAVDYGLIASNPCSKVKRYKVDNRRERVLSYDEEVRLFSALEGDYAKLRPIMSLALYAGMRKGEILQMKWENFDFNLNVIHIPKQITKTGKGRDVPMNAIVKQSLIDLRGEKNKTGRVFSSGYSESHVAILVMRVCESIGLTDVRLHVLRHSFATRLKDAGVNPFTVRDLLGHTEVQMTGYYTHASLETMKKGVELLEKRPDCPEFVAR